MTPEAAAHRFFAAAVAGDMRRAWRLLEPAYREGLVLTWAQETGAPIVESFAADHCTDEGWTLFLDDQRRACRTSWGREAERSWQWSSRPRPVALDCERVVLFDGSAFDDPERAELDTMLVSAVTFFMRRDDRRKWLIAGLNDAPPDWPAPG